MARDLPHDEPQQEDNLLIEAVSLLVERQRETERWVAEQIDQADERAASAERRYAELQDRLAAIEVQLDRLVGELEPGRGDAASGQRLARLREQVEDLKSDTDGRPLRPVPAPPSRSLDTGSAQVIVAQKTEAAEPPARAPMPAHPAAGASPWALFGATPQDRFGILLIFLGAVAVLYAVLTQLRV